MAKFKFIDLFCGIGGFHQAMASLGGECVFACDIDPDCQKTYYRNYGLMPEGDITRVPASAIPAHDVVCGGFPCQAFSIAGKRLGFQDPTKGTLFFDVVRIIRHHHPKYLLLENVRNLASHDGGNTWKVIHQTLDEAGYNVSPEPIIFSPHLLGVPQRRERVFILGIRKDLGELPPFYFDRDEAKPSSIYSVLQDEDEIQNLEKYKLKKYEVELIELWNEFLDGISDKVKKPPMFPVTDLFLHDSVSKFDYYSLTEQKAATARRNVELFNTAPEFITEWLRKANKHPKFKGSKRMLEWHAGRVAKPNLWDTVMQFRQSGIRARRTDRFPTLTAVLMTPIIGPRRRRLTPRECARLQSFPDTFIYDEKEGQAYKQFGNSVNVEVVRLFASFLLGDEEVQKQYAPPRDEFGNIIEKKKRPGTGRKRGRPRKYPLELDENGNPIKRKRGRPRKYPIELDENGNPIKRPTGRPPKEKKPAPPVVLGPDGLPIKRKRGRPRKYPLPEAPAAPVQAVDGANQTAPSAPDQPVKRKRGRPRKNPL